MVVSDLAVLEGALERTERDAIAFGSSTALGVFVCHCLFHVLDEIATYRADNFEEIVSIVVLCHPKRDILVAKRILAEFLKLANLSLAELRQEAIVVGPE